MSLLSPTWALANMQLGLWSYNEALGPKKSAILAPRIDSNDSLAMPGLLVASFASQMGPRQTKREKLIHAELDSR